MTNVVAIISLSVACFYLILAIVFIVLLVRFKKENKRREILTKNLLEIEEKRKQEETERLWKEMKENEKEIY